MSIDTARDAAIARQRNTSFVAAALSAALSSVTNPIAQLGRMPSRLEFLRHLDPFGRSSYASRDDLVAMFGPLKRPRRRPGASTSLRFDQAQRRDRRHKRASYVNFAALRKARRATA